jgi:hypothetical protein
VSKRINVNPDHYKTGGRERPGKDVVVEQEKQELARAKRSLPAPKRAAARPPASSKRSTARPRSGGR